MKKWLDKYKDISIAQNGIEGTMDGLTDKGFNYNGAWGGPSMQEGGNIPQAQDGLLEKLKSRLNPYNWGVEDYSKEKDFNKAYSTAKKSGEKEFMYKGKRYNTKYAGTPRQEVGAYGVDGKPVNIKEASDPSQVNLYPAFGKYLPGHVSASVTSDSDAASVDYSSMGNNPFGLSKVKNKGEHTYYVYGADQDKFYEKAAALPTGDYMLEDKYTPSDWNLFTNNCADNVCDAFGIPRSKGIQTPSGAVSKIKKKYPTLDVTGRTSKDYSKLVNDVNEKDVLKNSDKLTSIYFSPDTDSELKKDIGLKLQKALRNSGYDLPKSYIKGNKWNVDKIIGDETLNALKDWKSKNKSLAMGGSLPGAVGFTYARTGGIPSNGPYAKKTKASAQNGMEMKFYQEGLDWKPRNISKQGSKIKKDDNGYWNPENWGKPVEIGSNEITMQGVYEPLLGISDTGDTQMMYPGEDYTFDGESVTEYPIAQSGDWIQRAANANLNFWEKCRLASSADNGGGGKSGGGSGAVSKYKNPYEEISDISTYEKDERKAFKNTLPAGVELSDWVAMNRDASRMNALLRNPDYDKYTDSTGTLKPEFQSSATRFDPYYLYYKPAFAGKKEITPQDVLKYQQSQPGGLPGYKELVNRRYMPEKKKNGGWLEKYK